VPEYLAPGVYVEEVSFRSKSIEGVSTSTSAFAGLCRRGPLGVSPVLVTSFGDFQRIYGGLANLTPSAGDVLNYMAHAVRAYFDNGGSRLYIARVFNAEDIAACCARSAESGIRFVARFPGVAGNGTIRLIPSVAAATVRAMGRAPDGTMVRTGVADPQVPATIHGGPLPASFSASGKLLLHVGTTDVDIAITGEPVEATGDALTEPLALPDGTKLLVRIDNGPEQTITIPNGLTTRGSVAAAINRALSGGYARITTNTDAAGENRLAIGSDNFGTRGSVSVATLAPLGFAARTDAQGTGGANTVPNRRRVTVDDLNALLTGHGVVASVDSAQRLVLTTTARGTSAHINVRTGGGSVHAGFGFAGTETDNGEGANPLSYFVKSGEQWTGPTGALTWPANQDASVAPVGSNGAEFVTLSVITTDGDGLERQYQGLGFSPLHPQYIGNVLNASPTRQSSAIENLYALDAGAATAFDLRAALMPTETESLVTLSNGSDGSTPIADNYSAALDLFHRWEDISIVACPGESIFTAQHQAIQQALITHCEQRRSYRIAVLDTARDASNEDVRTERSRIDSTYAALYYPWVVVSNPLQKPGDDTIPQEITLPPSGFVCGVYARTDIQKGVFKAPANEVVLGALRFEADVNFAEQQVLNPLGINCLRFLPGRGNRIWGARTASSDPEWKYVSVRRYFNYLERSIDVGTQWAVFEPNGERLWANVRETLASFLFNEWRSGALLGGTAREAFFVKCDRSTMDQNDLDNGRLVCLVGVAVVKPAEFVIFRIGQKTADARN
jgi:phage tail sheath protein FI